MTEPTNIVPDPLDALLRPSAPGEGDGALRRRLLEKTTRALRRRRRVRIFAWAAALAACYAAGVATTYLLLPGRVQVIAQALPAPPPAPAAPVTPPATAAPSSAVALEWKAFDAENPRPDLYRQAADHYLHDDGDPASALRCYGQSLSGAADKDLTISPDDDYLLMLVKQARQKEKDDAKNGN